ncbi:MAG: caspase family protein [Myxococcaceae bacterium]
MTPVCLALATAALLGLGSPPAPAVRRALVVAFDGSDQPGVPALRYADDDGLLWAETLERLGVEVVLLTVPDRATSAQGSALLPRAQLPSRAQLARAVEELGRRNAVDRAHGRTVDVLFIYVGHGAVDDAGRSYLTLADGRLDSSELYEEVVDRLGADYVHLIVDACRAAGVVGRRGGDPLVLEQVREALAQEKLAQRPSVGAFFAESPDGETHEWSRLKAGVFSHALRSGLLGGADVNLDGLVEYSELDACVAAAFAGVEGGRARLAVRTFPPLLAPRRPLAGPVPAGAVLRLPPGSYLRLSVEDGRGALLADIHRAAGALLLALPERAEYWLRSPEGEGKVARAQLGEPLPQPRVAELSARGSLEESLQRGLFAVPYTRSFYDGYVASAGLSPVPLAVEAEQQPTGPSSNGKGLLEVEASAALAPLGLDGLAGGVAMAWRTGTTPLRFGARVSYGWAPRAWEQTADVHRLSVIGLAELTMPGEVAPYASLGAGWLFVGVLGPGRAQGDAAALTAQLALGVRWNGPLRLRVSALVDLDWVGVDDGRWLTFSPGISLGLQL